jgi:hypothetical protein
MADRDYPVGHPAAADYANQPYTPPIAPNAEDYPLGHPARGGKNVDALSTVDGQRAYYLKLFEDNHKRTVTARAEAIAAHEQATTQQ